MKPMQKISEWFFNGSLKELITLSTKSPIALGHTGAWYVFEHIFCPIRLPTSSGMPEQWTYYDIGYTFAELASMFWAKYGGNYFGEIYKDAAAFRAAAAAGESRTLMLFEAVMRSNIDKYAKLIELQGYTYNPLYNVDGVEMFASADMHGDETRTSVFEDTRTHTVSTYEAGTKTEYEDTTKSPAAGDTLTTTHTGTGHGAAAGDNAFGEAVTDADLYHVDKRIRSGNIGLTKSTELITAQRDALRYSVVQEYFDDLAKVAVIPIF